MDLKLNLDYDKCDMSAGYLTIQVSGRKKGKKGQIEEKTMKFQNVTTVLESLQSRDNGISDEIRVSLLQAILFRLKDSTSPFPLPCQVCISVDERTVNVCHQSSKGQVTTTLSDIARLLLPKAKLISKDLQTLADDFCEIVSKSHCDVSKALTHPLFWTASNKIKYLEMTWAKENCEYETMRLSKCHDGTFTLKDGKIGDNWIDALWIPENECDDLNQKLKKPPESSLCIEQSTMSKFTEKVPYRKFTNDGPIECWRKYKGSSWKEFLFFFRNIHAHFHEQKEEIRCCFNYDSEEGYWGFFSRRFPGLFMSVFKTYGHSVSFQEAVEPKFLPSHEKTGSKASATKSDHVRLKYRYKSVRTGSRSHAQVVSN